MQKKLLLLNSNNMKTQKEIENLAKEYANIPLHKDIDEEERYFQGHACRIYDAFIAGSKIVDNTNEEFNELVFKNYINSFSEPIKMKMLKILACEISTVNPELNNLLNRVSAFKKNQF